MMWSYQPSNQKSVMLWHLVSEGLGWVVWILTRECNNVIMALLIMDKLWQFLVIHIFWQVAVIKILNYKHISICYSIMHRRTEKSRKCTRKKKRPGTRSLGKTTSVVLFWCLWEIRYYNRKGYWFDMDVVSLLLLIVFD